MTDSSGEGRKLRWLSLATHVSSDGTGGGMIRYAVEFTRALARRPDIEAHVIAHPRAVDFFTELLGSPDRVHPVPAAPVPVVSLYERYVLARLGRQFDVVHGIKHLLPVRLPGSRARFLLTVHDMLPLDRPRDFGVVKRYLLREPYLASIRAADAVACVSAATADRVASYVPAARRRTVVVPLAAGDGAVFAVEPEPVPALVGRPFALVVGDDSPRKNLGLLLDAIELIRRQVPQAVLAIAGPPNWGVSSDADLIRGLVEQDAVVQLGFVSDGQLRWCYQQARVVCCPSALEGFGLPALEALQFGTPLITSDDPALVEVSGPQVLHLSSWDPTDWVDPLVERLSDGWRPVASPHSALMGRCWDDVVAETVRAISG